ncbi:peroxin 11C [Colletotrichum orchidophilum]|uniref:Peroxin 11C n=1 Tax=Colletotrichum orchidophilum TaxID=1209926 RepID=A0A1G4BQ86_9PEZI|nr:peroxin 11C [Colletotrichum orchidophilum]OHF03590.1 peroxin 11C [Colletotrichum orchidophilum]
MSTETADQAPAVSDLPSGDPIPAAPAPPTAAASRSTAAAAAAPKGKKPTLGQLLAATPSNVDAFVAHLNRCFATPSGIDAVLCFICYTSRFTASVIDALSASALRHSARKLVALAFSLPPDTTILLSKAPAPSAAVASRGIRVAGHLRALASLLSEARTITRLWALLPLYLWLRRLMTTPSITEEEKKQNTKDASEAALDRALSWLQVVVCLLLQSLESSSYLASKGVLPMTPKQQGTAARWSVRFWSVFVGSELGRLAVEKLRRQGKIRRGEQDVTSSEYRAWADVWARTLARQASWFPLTLHWSMDKGFVPEMGIGLLGSIPGIVQMRQLWKETA